MLETGQFQPWLDDWTVDDPDARPAFKDLYDSYRRYCRGNGTKAQSKKALGSWLNEQGYEGQSNGEHRYRIGLSLVESSGVDDGELEEEEPWSLRDFEGMLVTPPHLSDKMADLFERVAPGIEGDDPKIYALITACETWDMAEECKRQIKKDGGMFFNNHLGNRAEHPAVNRLSRCNSEFVRFMNSIGFDGADELDFPTL